ARVAVASLLRLGTGNIMPTRAPPVDHRRLSGVILEGYSVGVVLGFFVSRPPLAPAKAFSRSGCGRIFSLFSRVMRVGLSTAPAARWPRSGLSGPIFSGPLDCAHSV